MKTEETQRETLTREIILASKSLGAKIDDLSTFNPRLSQTDRDLIKQSLQSSFVLTEAVKGVSIPQEVKVKQIREIKIDNKTARFLWIFSSVSTVIIGIAISAAAYFYSENKLTNETYKNFPSPDEYNWYVSFNEHFEKLHPKDSQIYLKSKPFPKK